MLLVQLGDRLGDAERGPHRALGVVLVRHGSPEHGHDRVADELLDRAPEALDLPLEAGVIGGERGAYVLGIGVVGARSEADQVDEQDRDDLALLGCGSSRGCQGGAAFEAELRPLGILGSAARAQRHEAKHKTGRVVF